MSLRAILSWQQIETLPLLVLHTMLARAEVEIDETLARHQERSLIPGEGQREKWASVRAPDDVRRLAGVDQKLLNYYADLAELCRLREEFEIAQLRAAAAA